MTLTYQGRLPGVDCIATLPTQPQPIRLDVPAFVGLAAQGPVNQPTPVEDINQYLAVFGGDLVLAQNNGVPVYANLPATVKSFFDNGGTRCYVVRVAGPGARAARWLLPGVRRWWPDGTVEEVFVGASWPGAWSGGIEVGTQLLAQPLAVAGEYQPASTGTPGSLPLAAASALTVAPGDLIALDFGPSGPGLYVTAAGVSSGPWAVTVGSEVPLDLGPAVTLPGPLPVVSATLLRFDLVVRQTQPGGGAQQLEQWLNLTFDPPGTTGTLYWLDVTQQGAAPDLSVSLFLRADPDAQAGTGIFVPLAMDALGTPAEFVDTIVGSLPNPGVVAGSDDLDSFDPVSLFLDPHLMGDTVYDLIDDANSYTVLSSDPISLIGIHSLIGVDEVAMISVPDATQLGWAEIVPVPVTPPPPPPPPVPPPVDWAHFQCCAAPPPVVPPAAPAPPSPPTPLPFPVENDSASYDPSGLMSVQVALVQLCAARADAVAILSVPAHYSAVDFLGWSQQITTDGRISGGPLSYAAAWHPWVQIIEPSTPQLSPLRPLPPDGPATGTIATQEHSRGVWVAPANIALRGVVDLTPPMSAGDEVSLFNAHDNLILHEPGAFVSLAAHTLSADPTLLQLSVRRLLILLRKIALERGMRYVFQTNTDRFRAMVRRTFQQLLAALTQAGAIVNYQVVTGGGVNSPGDLAMGQLIIQLLIAPSSPIEFITVTLVRSGEGLLDVLGGLVVTAPFTTFRFEVVLDLDDPIDGVGSPVCDAAFSECDGLEMSMEPKTLVVGGLNDRQIHLIGPVKFAQLTLKRGMTSDLSLWNWVAALGQSTVATASGTVTMWDTDSTPLIEFSLTGCLPVRVRAPSLNAREGLIAIEELSLVYETMTVAPAGAAGLGVSLGVSAGIGLSASASVGVSVSGGVSL